MKCNKTPLEELLPRPCVGPEAVNYSCTKPNLPYQYIVIIMLHLLLPEHKIFDGFKINDTRPWLLGGSYTSSKTPSRTKPWLKQHKSKSEGYS